MHPTQVDSVYPLARSVALLLIPFLHTTLPFPLMPFPVYSCITHDGVKKLHVPSTIPLFDKHVFEFYKGFH